MNISYACSEQAWENVTSHVENLILANGAKRILEVGGGANPSFSLEFVKKHGLEYSILDISATELAKAPDGYLKVEADITDYGLTLPTEYDLIFSRMLAEHVRDGKCFHQNVYRLLAKGGTAFHFFPTLYAPPFVVNRLLPETLAEKILHLLQPGREQDGKHAKFPAYYSWCRGPLAKQIKRFESLGFTVTEYIGYFGHAAYYAKIPLYYAFHQRLSAWLVRHPIPHLTSFAYVTLQKGEQ